jgi:diaminopropionate ammonia-lyase
LINNISSCGIKYLLSTPSAKTIFADYNDAMARPVTRFHRTLPGYAPTRLAVLDNLAKHWGVGKILVKDESARFGLKAFKVLGGSYAVARLIGEKLGLNLERSDFQDLAGDVVRKKIGPMTLTTATDGNHGRGVAWTAQQLGLKAVIFMPKGTVASRVAHIRAHGACVEVTDLNYDDTVRLAWQQANENGWQVIQDTAWEGYTDIPRWIMQGYTTLSAEAIDQLARRELNPSHVFVQAGVGAFAAAMIAHLADVFKDRPPRFIVVEPSRAACMLESAAAGRPRSVTGDLDTIMAGLACGEPSPLAWGIFKEWVCCFISCDDDISADGMRILATPLVADPPVEAGESGSVGIGLLDRLINCPECADLKQALSIGPESTMLIFNTEGATDPVNYRDVVWYGKYCGNSSLRNRIHSAG